MTRGNQNVTQFIVDLATHFGKRHDSEGAENRWLYSMFQNLKGYPNEILKAAAERIIAQREERSFPQVAEIKRVCEGLMRVTTFAVKHDGSEPVYLNDEERQTSTELAIEHQISMDKAAVWRKEIVTEYGSVDDFLLAKKPIMWWEKRAQ